VGGVWVQVPGFSYGTRSFVFFSGEKPQVFSADGRPYQVPFDDLSEAFAAGRTGSGRPA